MGRIKSLLEQCCQWLSQEVEVLCFTGDVDVFLCCVVHDIKSMLFFCLHN